MRELNTSGTLSSRLDETQAGRLYSVQVDAPTLEAIELMKDNGIGSMLVLDGEKLSGIFTEMDVMRRVLAEGLDPRATPIAEVMTRNPDHLQGRDSVALALHRMSHGRFRHIPLVDKGHRAVGMVSVKDIFWHLIRSTPKFPTEEVRAIGVKESIQRQLPGLDEIGLDHGREGEIEKALSSEAVHVPISELDLGPSVTIEEEAYMPEVFRRMKDRDTGSLLVLSEGGFVGIITERDLLQKVAGRSGDVSQVPVSEVCLKAPDTLSPDELVIDAMAFVEKGNYRRVPVVDEAGRPVGIFSVNRVVQRLVEYFSEEILNLPPKPVRRPRSREGA